MPKITNPVVINKIRRGLLEGKPDNKILVEAGLSKQTANHKANQCQILKVVKGCIRKELKENDVTVELIISNLNEDRELARKKKDIATMKECDVWLGKYLAMFTDRIKSLSDITMKSDEQEEFNRLRGTILSYSPSEN